MKDPTKMRNMTAKLEELCLLINSKDVTIPNVL